MQFTTFEKAKEYLDSFIRPTIFARVEADKHLSDPLERMRYLLQLLDNPHHQFPSIQVSGTSGKGSTAYLLSHILRTSGLNVGFTLSPHLEKIHERIQINNKSLSDTAFIEVLNALYPSVEQMSKEWIGSPSYFEIILAMALFYFAKKKVDIVVAEVGLEGRYDGTNALSPLLAIITNISLDHTRILGDTVERIAEEATSIIKEEGMMVITGVQQIPLKKMIEEKAKKVHAEVIYFNPEQITSHSVTTTGSTFSYQSTNGSFSELSLSLVGSYQLPNAALAIEAISSLNKKGYSISHNHISAALASATFPGRFEIMKGSVLTILDGAHNPAKMAAFLHDLSLLFPLKKKVFLIAFKEDKKIEEMIQMITQQADSIVVTQFSFSTDMQTNAAYFADTILQLVLDKKKSIPTEAILPSEDALEKAYQLAKELDALVVVTGSLYLVGEVRPLILQRAKE